MESLQVFHTKQFIDRNSLGCKNILYSCLLYLKNFSFDHVDVCFEKNSAFPCSPKKVIVDISFFRCFDGYNATVFAYGQVGCIYKG